MMTNKTLYSKYVQILKFSGDSLIHNFYFAVAKKSLRLKIIIFL